METSTIPRGLCPLDPPMRKCAVAASANNPAGNEDEAHVLTGLELTPDTERPHLVLLLIALHVPLAGTVTGLCDENQPQSMCAPTTLVGRGTRMNVCSHQSLAPRE